MAELKNGDLSKHWSPEDARRKAIENFLRGNAPVADDMQLQEMILPSRDMRQKASNLTSKTSGITQQTAATGAENAIRELLAKNNSYSSGSLSRALGRL